MPDNAAIRVSDKRERRDEAIAFTSINANMVPYRGRLAFRIARTVLALAGLLYYALTSSWTFTWVLAVLAAYAVYALGALPLGFVRR